MKLSANKFCLFVCGSVLACDVLNPGYGKFLHPLQAVEPVTQTMTRAVSRVEPVAKEVTLAAFPIGVRGNDCSSEAAPMTMLVGFNEKQWIDFKSKHKAKEVKTLAQAVEILGGAYCKTKDGDPKNTTFVFLPNYTQSSTLEITVPTQEKQLEAVIKKIEFKKDN